MELIAVVLHCSSSSERFSSAKALLDYGFANWALVSPDLEVRLDPVPVVLGTADSVQPVPEDASPILIDKAKQSAITRSVTLEPELTAPVRTGQQLGLLRIEADGVLVSGASAWGNSPKLLPPNSSLLTPILFPRKELP